MISLSFCDVPDNHIQIWMNILRWDLKTGQMQPDLAGGQKLQDWTESSVFGGSKIQLKTWPALGSSLHWLPNLVEQQSVTISLERRIKYSVIDLYILRLSALNRWPTGKNSFKVCQPPFVVFYSDIQVKMKNILQSLIISWCQLKSQSKQISLKYRHRRAKSTLCSVKAQVKNKLQ